MQLPRVPGNWVGVVARIDASSEEVKSFFDPISELIEHYRWEVSIGYMFTRVEQAHNHLLRGAAVKIHGVNGSTANCFVDGQHITRKEFSRLYKNVVGGSVPARAAKFLPEAEKNSRSCCAREARCGERSKNGYHIHCRVRRRYKR